MQGQMTSGANCIAQRAVITALKESPSRVQFMIDEFKERRDLILKLVSDIEGFKSNTPDGAFYIFPDVSHYFGKSYNGTTVVNANDFCMYLLNEANVATVTGEAFGSPNCMRISYAAADETLVEAVRRIKTALEKLA